MTTMIKSGTREFVATFLVVQGLSCLLWWVMLWQFPSTRGYFIFPGIPETVLLAFALPDVLLYGVTALVGAEAVARRWKCATALVALHAGGVLYAELHALSLAHASGGGWNGVVLMAPGAILLPFVVGYLIKDGR
jgi:hypothetical protein